MLHHTRAPFPTGLTAGLIALLLMVVPFDIRAQEPKTAEPTKVESKQVESKEPAKSDAAKEVTTPAIEAKVDAKNDTAKKDDAKNNDGKAAEDSKKEPTKKDDAKLPGQVVVTGATPPTTTQQSSGLFVSFLAFVALLVGSGVLGTLWAKAAGFPDYAFRFGLVVGSVVFSAVIAYAYWPPKLGIDLSGGFVLNYRIDRTKTEQASINMDELIGAITKRVNPSGTKEVTIRPYGLDEIEIIIPDASQEDLASIKRIITKLGSLEFRITANERDHAGIVAQARATNENVVRVKSTDPKTQKEVIKDVARWVPLSKDAEPDMQNDPGLVTRVTAQGEHQALIVLDDFNVTGDFLIDARQGVDRLGNPAVEFGFNAEGATRFSQLTGRNLPDRDTGFKRRLAILLDGALYSAPSVNDTIYDRGEITGMRDAKKVKEQVEVLDAGKLPAALYQEPTSELYIGPTLGLDTVKKGVLSMLVATGAVVVFMLFYYRFAGIVANLAVVLNTLITVALMMIFHAAFTLSGLAGLALTVGMAVDANVLIYERMREELQRGATLRMAIRNGFDRATTTIIDANVTTLIAGFVLYAIGSDQVKGFAVTLIIGLIANLFTAITVSRAIFDSAEKLRWIKTLKMMQMWTTTSIDFIGKRQIAVTLSVVIIAVGLAAAYVRGRGLLDIDFTGGTSVQVLFKQPKDIGAVREAVQTLPDVTVQDVKLATEDTGLRYLIVTSKPNTVTDDQGRVTEEDVVEKQLYEIFRGELAANDLTISDVKSLAKPAAKQGAAIERDDDRLLAFAPEVLLAQAEATKSDAVKSDAAPKAEAPKTEPAKTEPAKTEAPKTEAPKTEAPKTATTPASTTPAANATPVDPYEGGAQATLNFSEPIGRQILSDLINAQLKTLGKENAAFDLIDPKKQQGSTSTYGQWTLKIALPESEAVSILNTIKHKLVNEPFFPASSQVGAAVAGTTQQQALAAIVVSLALILAYVWFRFAQVTFGIAAVVAVIHDVLVTLGALALSYWLARPLEFLGVDQFKINLPIIAAFLTIIGYSLNDTIVIFDRIREIRGKSTAITVDLVNLSINQTLSRTLLTSMTVFITVLILYAIGGQGIHGFAFALVVGTIAGTYSTVYIATPIVIWLHNWQAGNAATASRSISQRAAL